MSVLSILLWSTTPLFGLAALLGMSRFERYLLEDREDGKARADARTASGVADETAETVDIAGIATGMPAKPVAPSRRTAA